VTARRQTSSDRAQRRVRATAAGHAGEDDDRRPRPRPAARANDLGADTVERRLLRARPPREGASRASGEAAVLRRRERKRDTGLRSGEREQRVSGHGC
jgi:hypothetical protein